MHKQNATPKPERDDNPPNREEATVSELMTTEETTMPPIPEQMSVERRQYLEERLAEQFSEGEDIEDDDDLSLYLPR
ncbi:hypothetical protein Cylst_0078 [Cylindrospermum stagnale PCC 7417]|uniref:Uncharacterized protein n=1 Tax=Cylindrospermum stagnale PCC 7417 TaxID=56107 RepID=K9WRP8_9NOST|nr:hypothetical protein [Cylindrospermum stagnale]AFZ22459.1 hypothetical protein Cylst_0078 [Cylindrospermum stagnale PCC 7417]